MQLSDAELLINEIFQFYIPILGVTGVVYGAVLTVRKILSI